jgi:SnoaL-like domain
MHNSISGTEAADRLAIRELAKAYAHCADRRDVKGQMSLFTPDTHFIVFMDPKSTQPAMDLNGREYLAPVFADLNRYHSARSMRLKSPCSHDRCPRLGGNAQV